MNGRIESTILIGSVFVIAWETREALDPVQGQLELEARSGSAYVALVTSSVTDVYTVPLLKRPLDGG